MSLVITKLILLYSVSGVIAWWLVNSLRYIKRRDKEFSTLLNTALLFIIIILGGALIGNAYLTGLILDTNSPNIVILLASMFWVPFISAANIFKHGQIE